MKTVLVCHAEDQLNRDGLARWLASFSNLAGVIVLKETAKRKRRRVRREIRRIGWVRMVDVAAFRIYYRIFLAARDRAWDRALLDRLQRRFPAAEAEELITTSPNTSQAESFIRGLAPDMVIARCKTLIKESVFTIPKCGTYVMHPGICPRYRNSHGCFWALANDDRENAGMTLLRIDRGVDTGPVYGYYRYRGDDAAESHTVIQHRVVFDNLAAIETKLIEIAQGEARAIDTAGQPSAAWGQPWLTKYLAWKRRARARSRRG